MGNTTNHNLNENVGNVQQEGPEAGGDTNANTSNQGGITPASSTPHNPNKVVVIQKDTNVVKPKDNVD